MAETTAKGIDEQWQHFHMMEAEYMCTLAGILIVALTVIFMEHKLSLPPHSDHAALILALVARWLLLAVHESYSVPGVTLVSQGLVP